MKASQWISSPLDRRFGGERTGASLIRKAWASSKPGLFICFQSANQPFHGVGKLVFEHWGRHLGSGDLPCRLCRSELFKEIKADGLRFGVIHENELSASRSAVLGLMALLEQRQADMRNLSSSKSPLAMRRAVFDEKRESNSFFGMASIVLTSPFSFSSLSSSIVTMVSLPTSKVNRRAVRLIRFGF